MRKSPLQVHGELKPTQLGAPRKLKFRSAIREAPGRHKPRIILDHGLYSSRFRHDSLGLTRVACVGGGQYTAPMPELSRFFGIIIRMFTEIGGPHHRPHFHAYYQDDVGIFSIDPADLIARSLPQRQRRLVEAWAELHQSELRADWQRLQHGTRTDRGAKMTI